MNMNEYNEKVRKATERDKAVAGVHDVSNQGRRDTKVVTTPTGQNVTIQMYGR